jgi:hypothetical protein
MRLPSAVIALGQDPTAPAPGQSPPGLRTSPAQTPSPRPGTTQENGKNSRLTFRHPPANIAPCSVRLKNKIEIKEHELCGTIFLHFFADYHRYPHM